ncbi:HAD hydrolase-like protein [Streptomyces coelicoflavus]|uniref:HAD hydrolase-like protein n=1 Tax=Streptomyces coelicoflavus TaxID=285562 RepID=UPI0036D00E63
MNGQWPKSSSRASSASARPGSARAQEHCSPTSATVATASRSSLLPHTKLLAETAESGVTHLFDRIDGRRAPGTTKAQALVTHLEAIGRPLDSRHEVLLIGDTRDDAVAAHAVGAHVVLVTGGLEKASSLHQGGAAVADGLDQAVALGLRLVHHGTRSTALTTKSGSRQPIPRPGPEIDRRGAGRRTR